MSKAKIETGVRIIAIVLGIMIMFLRLYDLLHTISMVFQRELIINSTYTRTSLLEDSLFFLVGLAFFLWGIMDFRFLGRVRQYDSVWEGQDYVELSTLEEESYYSYDQILRDVKRAIRRKMLPGAKLDVQEGMLILDGNLYSEYEDAWADWNGQQKKLASYDVTLDQQKGFAQGQEILKRFQENDFQIENPGIRNHINEIIGEANRRMKHAKGHPEQIASVMPLCQYLPRLYQMTVNYQYMEQLDSSAKDSAAAKALENFLGEFH